MKNCKGNLIPQYKATKHTQKNPFYLHPKDDSVWPEDTFYQTPQEDNLLWPENTTDEFLTIPVQEEIESICADCKQSNCGSGYEETIIKVR